MSLIKTLFLILTLIAVASSDDRCPDPKEIAPCSCDLEGMSCFTIKTDEELLRVFKAKSSIKAARAFWLNGTPIKSIKSGTFNGYKFQHLYLDKNLIESIDSGAFTGSEDTLQSLSVYDNHLKVFPFTDLVNFKKLDSLSLASNFLTEIPADAFKGAPKLTGVTLRNNQIKAIGKDAFNNIDTLESIDLSQNLLTTLAANSLSVSSAGVVITLANNKISSIHKDAFLWTNLLQLDLSGNSLKSLPPMTFYPIVKSLVNNHGAMLVADNPLTCTGCDDYKWIINNARLLYRMLVEFECTNGNTISDLDYRSIGCESVNLFDLSD